MAACADSCMTSPSFPVVSIFPRPSMTVASVVRIDPPTSVQASPVVAPISFFLSRSMSLNQGLQPLVGENHLLFGNTGLPALFGDKKPLGNFKLFEFRVAGQPDHFHTILECRRNRMQDVCRRDKEDLAQIILDIEIVIH